MLRPARHADSVHGHARAAEKTSRELDVVPFGIVGLETLLPLCIRTLIETSLLTWPQLIAKLTCGPAGVLGLNDRGTLAPGVESYAAAYTEDLVGAEAVRDGSRPSAKGVRVPQGNRLVIKLKHKTPDFPARMIMPAFCAVPPNTPPDEYDVVLFGPQRRTYARFRGGEELR